MSAEEPPTKKSKTEEEGKEEGAQGDAEMKDKEPETPKAPEPPPELEKDAAPVKGAKIKEAVIFNTADTTMNVMSSTVGGLLVPLSDGGVQHLLAGARANAGIKSGRYMFEAKIVENLSPQGDDRNQRLPQPKNYFRIGFTTEKASLFAGQTADGICFDTDGKLITGNKPTHVNSRFGRDIVISVLLNLDTKSENKNTISLFKDGVRACQPQPLPEHLVGKTLYPTVTFRNVTVHVNFGPNPLAPLPFKCHMVGAAAESDVAIKSYPAPKDGKYDVLFPVGLPDEGPFEWLDMFLAKNPDYTELSDRMINAWAESSGLPRSKADSNDKPKANFGAKELDDGSIRRILYSSAPAQNRNFVVMEVKGNLTKQDREASMAKFAGGSFKKTACVIVGEPKADFKKKTNEMTLTAKQEESDRAFKVELAEKKRKKEIAKRQKELEKQKKKQEKVRKAQIKQKAAEAKKKLEEAKKAKEEAEKKAKEEKGEGEEEKKDEEPKKEEEEKKEEAAEEPEEEESAEEEEAPEEPDEPDPDPPKVELTAEEKKQFFVKKSIPDISPVVLSASFPNFSLPSKDEGFDKVTYEWSGEEKKSQDYVKAWILQKKLTTRVENISPGKWFWGKNEEAKQSSKKWWDKLAQYKAAVQKKAAEKTRKAAEKERKAKQAAAEAAAKEAKEKAAAEKKESGEDKDGEEKKEEEKKEPEKEPEKEEKEESEEEQEETPVDFEGVDVFGQEDVTDIGNGMPLFKDFSNDDWEMLNLRLELHMLVHGFKKDVEDPERPGIHMDHLQFYYQKYHKKSLETKKYGVETLPELLAMVSDTIGTDKSQVISPLLEGEMESLQVFVKLVEEDRRDRALRFDLGEEGAKLKIQSSGYQGGGYQQKWGDRAGGYGQKWGDGNQGGGNRSWQQQGGNQQQQQGGYGKSGGQNWKQSSGKGGDNKPGWSQPYNNQGRQQNWSSQGRQNWGGKK